MGRDRLLMEEPMLSILVKPRRMNFDRLWNTVKRQPWLGPKVNREIDLPLAMDLHRQTLKIPTFKETMQICFASWIFGPMAFRGADGGYGGESQRWLEPDTPLVEDWTGTGIEQNWNIHDCIKLTFIGHTFSVASTTTKLKLNWDSWTAPFATGTETTDLDGTTGSGVLEAPAAIQAIGTIFYKDLSDISITLEFGNSLEMDVVTATTAGKGISWALFNPSPELVSNATNVNAASG